MGDLSTPPTTPPTTPSTTPQGVGGAGRAIANADPAPANMGPQGLLPGAEITATPQLTLRDAHAVAKDLEQVQKGWHILKAICVFFKNLFSKGEKTTVQKEIAREWHEKNKEQMAGNLEIMANPAVLASLEVGHPRKYAEMLQTIDGLLSTNYAVAFLRKTSATIHSIMDNAASGTEMELEDSQWDALLANAYGICDQASSSSATLFNPASTLGSVIEFREQHPDNRIPVGDLLVLANEASSMLANEASSTSPSLARIIEERGEVPAPLRTPGVIAQIARAGISLRDTPFQNEFEILNFMARCKNVGDPTALVQACIDNFKNRRGLEFRKLANIASPHRGAMDDIEMSDDVIVLCLTGGDERNVAAAVALAEAGIPANAITGDVVTKVAEKGMQTLRGSDSIQETEGFKCLKRAMIRCGTPDMKLALVRAYIVKPDDMKTLDSAVDRYETPEARQALVEFFLTDMDHCLSLCRYSENIDAGKPTERLISLCAANPGPICNAIYDLCSSKQIPEGIVTTDLIKEYCAHKTIFDEDVKAIMDRCNDLEMNKGLIGLFCTDPDKCTELRKLMNDGLSHETIVWLVNRNNRTECIGIASKLRELGVGCDLITQKLIEPASAHPKEFEELAKRLGDCSTAEEKAVLIGLFIKNPQGTHESFDALVELGIPKVAITETLIDRYTADSGAFEALKTAVGHCRDDQAKGALVKFFEEKPKECEQFCKWIAEGSLGTPITKEQVACCAADSGAFEALKTAVGHCRDDQAKGALVKFFEENPKECEQFCKWTAEWAAETPVISNELVTKDLITLCAENPEDSKTLRTATGRCETPEARRALVEFFTKNRENCVRFCKLVAAHRRNTSRPEDDIQMGEDLITLCAEDPKYIEVVEKLATGTFHPDTNESNSDTDEVKPAKIPISGQVIRADLVKWCADVADVADVDVRIAVLKVLLVHNVPGEAITVNLLQACLNDDGKLPGSLLDALEKFNNNSNTRTHLVNLFTKNQENCLRFCNLILAQDNISVQVDEDLVELLGGGTYIDTLEKLCNEHNQYVEGRGKGIKFIPTINADMVRGANTDEDVYKCAVQTMAGISIAYDREIERIAECAQTSGTSFWVFGPKQKIKVMQPRSFFNSEKVEVEKELPTVNAAVVLKALEENLLKEAQAKKSSKKTV